MLEFSNKSVLKNREPIIETFSPKIQSSNFKEESTKIISHLDLNSIGERKLSFVKSDGSSNSNNSSKSSSSNSNNSSKSFSSNSNNSSKSSSSNSNNSSNSSKSNDYEAECELFIQIVTDIFNPDEIGDASIYSVVGDTEGQGASEDESIVAVINIFNKDTEELCTVFEYLSDEKLITLLEIKRCSDDTSIEGSGTHIINNIKKVYFALKSELKTDIKMVIESDQSKIIVFIDEKEGFIGLSWLYLFSHGQSWYNKLGFREANFDENSRLINNFIHRPANSVFTKEDIKLLKVYRVLLNEENSVQEIYAKIMRRIREISNNPSKKILKEFIFFREFLVRTRVFFLDTITAEQMKLFQRKFTEIMFQNTLGLGRHPFPSFRKRWRQKFAFKKSHKIAKKTSFKKKMLRNKRQYTLRKVITRHQRKHILRKKCNEVRVKRNKNMFSIFDIF